MKRILIIVALVLLTSLHFAVRPPVTIAKNVLLEETANEYHSRCIAKTGKDYKYYNCEDLRKYLVKRGYDGRTN